MKLWAEVIDLLKAKGVSQFGAERLLRENSKLLEVIDDVDVKTDFIWVVLNAYMSVIKSMLLARYYKKMLPSSDMLPCNKICARFSKGGPACELPGRETLDTLRCLDYRDHFRLWEWINDAIEPEKPLPLPLRPPSGSSGIIVYPFVVKWSFDDGSCGEFAAGLKEETPASGVYLFELYAFSARDAMLQAHIKIEAFCKAKVWPIRGIRYWTITDIVPNLREIKRGEIQC